MLREQVASFVLLGLISFGISHKSSINMETLQRSDSDEETELEYLPEKTLTTSRNGEISPGIPMSFMFDNLVTCHIKLPNGTIYEMYPRSNTTSSDYKLVTNLFQDCEVRIKRVTLDDADSSWTLTARTEETYQMQTFKVEFDEEIQTSPPRFLEVFQGEDVYFRLAEKVNKLLNCTTITPNRHVKNNTFTQTGSNDCQVIIRNVTTAIEGTWKIKAIGHITLSAEIKIYVKELPYVDLKKSIRLGSTVDLTFGPEKSAFCEVIDPSGVKSAHFQGPCNVRVERVLIMHQGLWKARVGLTNTTNTITYEYNVTIQDEKQIYANSKEVITAMTLFPDNSILTMVCSLVVTSAKSCRMIRYDGLVMILTEGIGNGRYSYFGNGTRINNIGDKVYDCGMMITSPTADDLKNWQCVIVHGENGNEIGGSIIIQQESKPENGNGNTMPTDNLDVTHGTFYDLMCAYPTVIGYCWFRAPNGTMFSVLPGADNDHYEYLGRGLMMGECGMRVKRASKSDDGVWVCSAGGKGAPDHSTQMKIKYHKTKLVALLKTLGVFGGSKLTCGTYDRTPLEYCRFVRPDGMGINPSISGSVYSDEGTDLENGKCSLTLNSPFYADVGTWICYGKPFQLAEEYYDTISVQSLTYWIRGPSALLILFYVLCVSGVITIIGVMLCYSNMGKRIRRRSGIIFARSMSMIKTPLSEA